MKPLLALLCAIFIGYVAYEFVYPPFGSYFGINKPPAPPPPPVKPAELVLNIPKVEMEKPKPEEPKPEPKPEMAPPPPPPPAPVVVAKPKEGEFVPPTFKTIEEITNNWTALPKSMFPRQVTIAKEIEVKGSVGATKIAAGGSAFAMAQEGNDLVIAPSAQSPFRAKLAMAETNIKEVITGVYDAYMVNQTERARQAHEQQRIAALAPKASMAKRGGADVAPVKEADGTFALLLESMKAGEVTEIKPDNIKKWGDVKREKVEKEDFYVVNLTFEANTAFGKFEQDALAYVKNNQVTKWVYAGSGEVIP
jgi:hypothetical protein